MCPVEITKKTYSVTDRYLRGKSNVLKNDIPNYFTIQFTNIEMYASYQKKF
jgi:hypothetical protein